MYNGVGPLAFKSQRVRYQSNQKLLHLYQYSTKSDSNKLILKIQQILGSHELKGGGQF